MNNISDEELRTLTEEQIRDLINLGIKEKLEKAAEEYPRRLKESGALWQAHLRADKTFYLDLRNWKHHDDKEKWEGQKQAFINAIADGVSDYRFLQACKRCVMENQPWTVEVLAEFLADEKTRKYTLKSPEMKKYLERTGEDKDPEDAASPS